MRLWDYRLLPYLDDFHIVAQWRELLAIKGAIDKNGTPNHRLVNKVLDYPIKHFKTYTFLVVKELDKRCIKYSKQKYNEIVHWQCDKFDETTHYIATRLYEGWHNNRYLTQCYYNLQEKFDCGIVSAGAWEKISKFYNLYKKEGIKNDR